MRQGTLHWPHLFLVGIWLAFLQPRLTAANFSGTSRATVKVYLKGPAGMNIEGQSAAVNVSDEANSIRFIVPLSTLDTGIELRNKHMREKYLETNKYPNAELVVARTDLTLPADGQTVQRTVKARFTVHGKTKEVSVTYQIERRATHFKFAGSFPFDMRDHSISTPSYLGVSVNPRGEIKVRGETDDR